MWSHLLLFCCIHGTLLFYVPRFPSCQVIMRTIRTIVISGNDKHTHKHREFKDVVFEDVVFDNNRFATLLSIVFIVTSMPDLLLSNTTSSNTTSLNSRQLLIHDDSLCYVLLGDRIFREGKYAGLRFAGRETQPQSGALRHCKPAACILGLTGANMHIYIYISIHISIVN